MGKHPRKLERIFLYSLRSYAIGDTPISILVREVGRLLKRKRATGDKVFRGSKPLFYLRPHELMSYIIRTSLGHFRFFWTEELFEKILERPDDVPDAMEKILVRPLTWRPCGVGKVDEFQNLNIGEIFEFAIVFGVINGTVKDC